MGQDGDAAAPGGAVVGDERTPQDGADTEDLERLRGEPCPLEPLRLDRAGEDRLVWIWSTRPDRDRAFFSIPNFEDYRSASRSFERLGAFTPWAANLAGAVEAERLQGCLLYTSPSPRDS